MSKFCFVCFAYLLCIFYVVECGVVNTGTVLFSSRDVSRHCWHPEEIAVLTTRMILQDLLPDASILEINNNDYVDDIVEYFRLLFEVVQKSTQGRSRHIMMLAMSDLIGGYLQHAVLPIARLAYYAGIIDFPSMEKLIQLYEELKWYLRTNGQGWAKPLQPKTEFEIEPIDLSKEGTRSNKSSCCQNLIYYQRPPVKREADDKNEKSSKVFFPVPFFDSKVRPSAIAVPFRRFALRNIESKRAAYMVLKYYVSVHNCLIDLHADKATVETFQNNLYTWVVQNCMPKLKDDKFYSAFGGIMRVEESLKAQGAKLASSSGTECFENEGDQELGTVPGGESTTRSSVLLISMLLTIFIWFVVGTLFICYRIRKSSKKGAQMNVVSPTSRSSSSLGSSSKSSSSKRTVDTTATEKSTELSSSQSGEFDREEDSRNGTRDTSKNLLKSFPFGDKSSKRDQSYGRTCFCDGPPTIEPKHSMKLLPSIPEMSENSSLKRDEWGKQNNNARNMTYILPKATSSKKDVTEERKNRSKIRICVPRVKDVDVTACPHYYDKGTSLSSSKSKSSNGTDAGTVISEPQIDDSAQKTEFHVTKDKTMATNENTTDEMTDNTGPTENSPHIYACHSSLTGNYTTDQRFQTEKPFIFGYDFQTSSSSDLSDEESDARTSTTK